MVLEKDGGDYLDWSCEKCRSVKEIKGDANGVQKTKTKCNSIGQILHGNCLLKYIMKEKI